MYKIENETMLDTYSKASVSRTAPIAHSQMTTKENKKISVSECTDFAMHISQKSNFSHNKVKLIDYFEYKLRKYIDEVEDKQQLAALKKMLAEYLSGKIAVAWRSGQPVYLNVTKG
jgi:hypothetical protein